MISFIKDFLNLNYYVSELDQFLKTFDKVNNKLSHSQLQEKEKYARIYKLRDKPLANNAEKTFWENF